uniref:discoidin domain-containing protein n=1 Tax=Maribacter sp. 2-571 TaxID=3417569 RepID=UPI003D34D065
MKRCKDVGNFPRSPPHLYGQTQKNMKDRSLLFSAFFSITMALFAQQPLTPVAVSATEEDRTNIVDNLFDGDLNTRWSANLDPVYATIDLGEVKRFAEVRIAYYKGDQRRAYFDLQRSDDGINWTDIRTGFQSSGTTLEPEPFPFEAQEGRYIRYVGRGNSAS